MKRMFKWSGWLSFKSLLSNGKKEGKKVDWRFFSKDVFSSLHPYAWMCRYKANNWIYSIMPASFEDGISNQVILPFKWVVIVWDKPLFLPKGREGVVHVQVPSGRQLQRAVVGRGAWDVDVVLVVRPLTPRLGVLGSPRVVRTCSLPESCPVFC